MKRARHLRPKGGATDRPSRNAGARRPERFPARGWNQRSTERLRNGDIASGEPIRRTAAYVTRTHGDVGRGSRETSPYPD